jgi:T5SS/PEP-CTERM-associated repeat protein
MTRVAHRATCIAAVQFFVFAIVSRAPAASDFWAAPASDYFDVSSRWADGGRPTAADSATFDEAGTYDVLFDEATFSIYGGEPTINDLTLTAGTVTFLTTSGPTRTLRMNGTGGSNTINGTNNLVLGNNASGNGTYTLSNSASLDVDNNLLVGVSGVGTLNIQDQSVVYVANAVNINASSAVNLNGGTPRLNSSDARHRTNFTSGKLQRGGERLIKTYIDRPKHT